MRNYSRPTWLPFPGIGRPMGLAFDSSGGLLVTDFEPDENAPPGLGVTKWARVSRIAPGGGDPVLIPISGLASPHGVAVGAAGEIYVADHNFPRLVVQTVGSDGPTVSLWPSVGEDRKLADVAVGPDGGVYAVYAPGFIRGEGNGAVLRMSEKASLFGKAKHEVLPFEVRFPSGIAVDAAGAVYVVDGRAVSRWAPGDPGPTALPLADLIAPQGVAVDAHGTVYVTDRGKAGGGEAKVVVLEQATGEQCPLPVDGLRAPSGIAVDAGGNVYIADPADRRVVLVPVA